MASSRITARRLTRRLGAFARAPSARKRLALEAAWALALARVATLGPARRYTRKLGALGAAERAADPDQLAAAREIGHVVAVTAASMPFRAVCLQQAIATRRMLARRAIPATVHLGLARSAAEERGDAAAPAYAAHAWVTCAGQVVNGEIDLDRYVVVGTFA